MKYIIYGLTDPDTLNIRYIGKSTSGLKRPKEHAKPSQLKVKSHKTNWIKSLDKPYGIFIIEELPTPEELDAREIYWIAEYKAKGANLVNGTDGGEGALGRVVNDEMKEKLRDKRLKFHLKNPEVAKNIGESQRKEHVIIDGKIHKECSDCNNLVLLINYSPKQENWDGHTSVCKPCKAIRTREYRELNPSVTLNNDEWKASYESRKEAMSNGAKAAYEANPELRANLSKKRSKPIIGIPLIAGQPELEFPSALLAKEAGFNNTYVSQAIKSGKAYKGYIWRFK